MTPHIARDIVAIPQRVRAVAVVGAGVAIGSLLGIATRAATQGSAPDGALPVALLAALAIIVGWSNAASP